MTLAMLRSQILGKFDDIHVYPIKIGVRSEEINIKNERIQLPSRLPFDGQLAQEGVRNP